MSKQNCFACQFEARSLPDYHLHLTSKSHKETLREYMRNKNRAKREILKCWLKDVSI